jgi:hypothetical protein
MIALAAEADTQRLNENELRDRAASLAASCNLDLQSLVDRIVTAAGPTSFGITS